MKTKRFEILLTEKQLALLEEKACNAGFGSKGDYLRFLLFADKTMVDKIDTIYRRVVKHEK